MGAIGNALKKPVFMQASSTNEDEFITFMKKV
jgi:hypothetical protein